MSRPDLHAPDCGGHRHLIFLRPRDTPRLVTHGRWNVTEIVHVDEVSHTVFFSSTLLSPLEVHLCAVSYADLLFPSSHTPSPSSSSSSISSSPLNSLNLAPISLLTTPNYTHTDFSVDPQVRFFLCNRSSLSSPPVTLVYSLTSRKLPDGSLYFYSSIVYVITFSPIVPPEGLKEWTLTKYCGKSGVTTIHPHLGEIWKEVTQNHLTQSDAFAFRPRLTYAAPYHFERVQWRGRDRRGRGGRRGSV